MICYSDGVSASLQQWRSARILSDRLFSLLDPAALHDRPIPERHRIIFYLGHLEAFEWNLLRGEQKPFDPTLDRLFAFGIDPVGGGLPTDQPGDWPTVETILRYNGRVQEALENTPKSELLLNVAIEHRLMHVETLSYMLHQLAPAKKRRDHSAELQFDGPLRKSGMIEVPAGEVALGLPRGTSEFGWDNEFEAHAVALPAFAIDRYKVTNGDYLQFVRAGGTPPVFWKQNGGEWIYQTMFEEIPLPLDWPVYVSHANAAAYASWAGKDLPTEEQWQRAACGAPPAGNYGCERWDPVPVTAFGAGASGIEDMRGNGWEWTSTLFEPFPGFEPFPFYPGYSADFFDGKHYVMKGGSPRTAARMLRPSFRNWFQPDYPYVYAGFRCVTRG
jgi:formylglycine-generating enzyme required for sulfatase activity